MYQVSRTGLFKDKSKFSFNAVAGNIISQGVELLLNEEIPNVYGIITIAINWLPGVVAATHMISTYRTKLPARNTVSIACKSQSIIINHCHILSIFKRFFAKYFYEIDIIIYCSAAFHILPDCSILCMRAFAMEKTTKAKQDNHRK